MGDLISMRTKKRIVRESRADITVEGDGSIWILRGRSDVGRDWIEENCDEGDYNPFGEGARLVEHRYVGAIVEGAADAGLRVVLAGSEQEVR